MNELKINLASGVEAQLERLNETLGKYLPLLVEALTPKPMDDKMVKSIAESIRNTPVQVASGESTPTVTVVTVQPTESTPAPAEEPAPAPAPAPAPTPVEEPKPVESPAPAAPSVTKEQVMEGGKQLMDKGMITELMALLKKYNSPSVVALPVEQLDAVAADLRALGADI